jgi:hypothetical protein
MINFSMQQDWWLLASMLALAFGAGFWGGVLQHAHLSAGDGGILTIYPRVLFRDTTNTLIINSIANNDVTFTVPGGTLGTQRLLRFTISGQLINNTGLAQVPPGITILYGGVNGIAWISGTTVPSTSNQYNMEITGHIAAEGATNIQRGMYDCWLQETSLRGPQQRETDGRTNFFGFSVDSTIDQPLIIRSNNAVANSLYTFKFTTITVELI